VTVVNVYTAVPKPGRYEDALEMNRASKKLLERHGAKDIRISAAVVAGAGYGSIINSCELDDMEAWGAFYDAVMADEEIQRMLAQVQGTNTPYATQSMGVATEIPLGRKRGNRGNLVYVIVSAVVPDRYQAAITLGGQAFDLLERHGGRNCRLWQQQANGILPDALVATIEFDNMTAYGKTVDSFMSDPGVQSIIELTQSSDSPIRAISSDIYTEVGD
jgi:hypothetical protein